jgi:hypothetical protein
MTDNDVYLIYSEQFRTIDDRLDDLVKQAVNFTQSNQITAAWKQANLNYLQARNKLFANRGGDIEASIQAFARGQEAIRALLEDLAKGSATIDRVAGVISEAVAIGTKLEQLGSSIASGGETPPRRSTGKASPSRE